MTLEDGPELHRHLSERVPGQSHGVGAAIHPGTTVPLGLAIDAATLAVNGKALGISILRYCSFSLEHRASTTEPLLATGRVVGLGARHVECVAEVWQHEHLICKARVGLCVRDGRAVPLSRYYVLDHEEAPSA